MYPGLTCIERWRQVVSQFDELVEEGHAAHDALLKIFTKKIKRSKKKDEGASLRSMVDGNVCYPQYGHSIHGKCPLHVKAHCISLEHLSLACLPRVDDVQAFDILLTCKWFHVHVAMIV